MPRSTIKQQNELALIETIETRLIIPPSNHKDKLSESLLLAYLYSASFRFLERDLYTSHIGRFDYFIYGESDAAFLATFRLSRPAFWRLIDLLIATRGDIWRQSFGGPGR